MNAYSNPSNILDFLFCVSGLVWHGLEYCFFLKMIYIYSELRSAKFAVSTDIRCNSPEGDVGSANFAVLYEWYGSYSG